MRTRERFSALASMRPLNKEMITPRQRGGKPKTPRFLLLFEKIQTKQPLDVATVVTDKSAANYRPLRFFRELSANLPVRISFRITQRLNIIKKSAARNSHTRL